MGTDDIAVKSATTITTTTSTTTTTTTPTQAPTLFQRAGSLVSGGLGGIVNSLANMGSIFSQATQPFWVPLGVGRRRREAEEKKEIFKRFLQFKQKLREMNPDKFKKIIKEVVRTVIEDEDLEGDSAAGLDTDLMAAHISSLLLRKKTQHLDSS